MKNTNYAYIIGRLRALETRLPTENVLERMIEADSADVAFQVLNDLSFVAGSMGDYGVDEFQTVLTKATEKMSRLLAKMTPDPYVMKFLWLKYDFHNLKVTLKARLAERGYADVEHALVDFGCMRAEDWEQFVFSGKLLPLTEGMHDTIADAVRQYELIQDSQIVDLIVDKHYLEELLAMASQFKSPLTIGYLQRLIDFTNLKTFIRCKELEKQDSYLEAVLLNGGRMPASFMPEHYSKSYEELKAGLEQKMYADELVVVLDEFIKEKTLLAVEKKTIELLQDYMDESKKMSFGPEPVFAFFWRFENHMQTLRSVLVGKLNQLPAEDIRKHVLTL